MDEEIDDERKARINRYGATERDPTIRRLRHEIGEKENMTKFLNTIVRN